jgi:hypothetical protein
MQRAKRCADSTGDLLKVAISISRSEKCVFASCHSQLFVGGYPISKMHQEDNFEKGAKILVCSVGHLRGCQKIYSYSHFVSRSYSLSSHIALPDQPELTASLKVLDEEDDDDHNASSR